MIIKKNTFSYINYVAWFNIMDYFCIILQILKDLKVYFQPNH